MTFLGNRTQVAHMVRQWFIHYATAAQKQKKKLYLVLCNTSMLNPIVINAPFL